MGLSNARSASSEVSREEKDACNCYWITIFYGCNVLEGKRMSCVKHNIAMTNTCVRRLLAMDGFHDLRKTDN